MNLFPLIFMMSFATSSILRPWELALLVSVITMNVFWFAKATMVGFAISFPSMNSFWVILKTLFLSTMPLVAAMAVDPANNRVSSIDINSGRGMDHCNVALLSDL